MRYTSKENTEAEKLIWQSIIRKNTGIVILTESVIIQTSLHFINFWKRIMKPNFQIKKNSSSLMK